MDADYKEYRKALIDLLHSIDAVVPLEKGERILILHTLNTVDKIRKFVNVLRPHIHGENNIDMTGTEIVRAAVWAAKER